MILRRLNDEVFIADEPIVRLGRAQVQFLKRQAMANARKRARICAHSSDDDALHEMLIAISSESYIRPHKHLGKSESFHIIEGEVDVVVLDEEGNIVELVELGEAGTGKSFFYRLSQPLFHTLLLHSDFLVVHEVTNGPFLKERTELAAFAPPESAPLEAKGYVKSLFQRVAELRAAR